MVMLTEVVEPVVGLTQDRWDVLMLVVAVVLFAVGVWVARSL